MVTIISTNFLFTPVFVLVLFYYYLLLFSLSLSLLSASLPPSLVFYILGKRAKTKAVIIAAQPQHHSLVQGELAGGRKSERAQGKKAMEKEKERGFVI
jgi:hypothetical protein